MIQKTKQNTFEQLWLSYYNDTLYEKGFITEDERNKMRLKIKEYTSKKANRNRKGEGDQSKIPH